MARRGINPDEWANPFNNKPKEETSATEPKTYTEDLTHEELFEVFSKHSVVSAANLKHFNVGYQDIDAIQPDPIQPRRTVPHSVRGDVTLTAETLPTIFERWLQAAEQERGEALDLKSYLRSMDSARSDRIIEAIKASDDARDADTPDPGPLEASLMHLVELAASIRKEGLLNPITVSANGSGYLIETGERRWLAYHLLRWHFGVEEEIQGRGKFRWDKMPATIVDEPDVWRQAVENNARDDLNAIGKARQLALLLMHIHREDQEFQPFNAFEHEQGFYAQVADGFKYRIPGGKAEQLAHALRFSSTKQLRDYRRLLKLPADLWDKADDENLPEGTIREIAKDWGSVPNGTLPTERPNGSGTLHSSASVPNGTLLKPIYSLRKKYVKKLDTYTPQEREAIIDEVNALLKDLKRLNRQLDSGD